MTALSAQQLLSRYDTPSFRARFVELYSLRILWSVGLKQKDYVPSSIIESAIVPTSFGEAVIRRALELDQSDQREASARTVKLALFLQLGHDDLLIDIDRTDIDAIRRELNHEVSSTRIRFPWVFGRCLYDRFFDMFSGFPDKLSPEDTQRLLSGTPPGVFQVADTLIGPLGLLRSSASRDLAPLRNPLSRTLVQKAASGSPNR